MEGSGKYLGIDVVWMMRARPDGAFCEQLSSKHWKSKLGYSGEPGSHSWEVRIISDWLRYGLDWDACFDRFQISALE